VRTTRAIFPKMRDKSTVVIVNLNLTASIACPFTACVKVAARNVCRMAILTLFLGASPLLAQETSETDVPATPTAPYQLLFVETPMAFEPELDVVVPEAAPALNPEDDPDYIARLEIIGNYDKAVEQAELDGGAWDQHLVEELAALGNLQQQQGNHLAAIDMFDRAIHINRIHSGLHTLEQISSVEKLIDSYLALGNWERADLYYNYLYYIQQKAYGPHDPRMIPVLSSLASWNIQAFNIGYGESLGIRLSTAQILLNAAASMVTVHFGDDDARFVSYRRNIANSAFLVSRNPELMAATDRLELRTIEETLLDQLDERNSTRPRGFGAGEMALREIVNFYARQENAQYELASALADLGDWFLMFERRRASQDLYIEALNILQKTDDAEASIEKLFGQVVPIPTFSNSVENLLTKPLTTADGKSLNSDFVDVVFDVMPTGTTRNIQILSEQNEFNQAMFSRLERVVRDSYFRPKIVNGEPVRSEQNYFRYRYWY